MSLNVPLSFDDYLESMSGLSRVWRDLTCDIILLIIDHTTDRSTLRSWSCVNRLLGLRAHCRLWNSVSLKMLYGCRARAFNNGELDALVRTCNRYTETPARHPLTEPIPLIETIELRITGNSCIHHSSSSSTQIKDYNSHVNDSNFDGLVFSLPNVRTLYLSGHIHHRVFRKFLAVNTLERLGLRVPLRMRISYEHKVLETVPDSLQRSRSRRDYPGPVILHHPLKLQLLAKYQNLRALNIHELSPTEAYGLAFAVRTLQLTELDVSAAGPTNHEGFSPLGSFLKELCVDDVDLGTGSDSPTPRVGFPITLKKLILNEDNENRYGQLYG